MSGREGPENPWARRNLLTDAQADQAPDAGGQGPDVPDPLPVEHASSGGSPAPYGSTAPSSPSVTEEPSPVLIAWYATDRQRVDPVPPHRRLPVWAEPVRPHLGGSDADDSAVASWWWLGVHGGAGVSTLAELLPGGAHAHRCWPDPAFGGPRAVVLVCRTHLAGLERARDAARQWASSDVPAGLLLGGAVAVADAPGRLPRPQSEALRLLSGAVPRLWTVPWIEELRAVDHPGRVTMPPAMARLGRDLDLLRSRPGVRPQGAR